MSEPNERSIRFTLSQFFQLMTLLVAGTLAWASLRYEVRELRLQTDYRLATVEARLASLETRLSRIEAMRHK